MFFSLQLRPPGYNKCEEVPVSLSTLSLSSCARVTSEYFLAGVDVHGRYRTREEREINSDLDPLTAYYFMTGRAISKPLGFVKAGEEKDHLMN